ncbi:MAG TPA: threonine ammonia-lyase, partial [Bacilli bacterium]|nr:threonine ammonia-lyase [Bacilli bacterium]
FILILFLILYLLETCRIVSEGSGATTVAAILSGKVSYPNKNVVAIITGGNIDVNLIETVINKGLIATDRRFEIKTVIYDRPGELQKLLSIISNLNGNIFNLEQRRFDKDININQQQVTLVIGCYGPEHKEQIIAKLKECGYQC